jgi:Na+-translocating ferredoxin:NAD+ oxidoreductase RnfC subunit
MALLLRICERTTVSEGKRVDSGKGIFAKLTRDSFVISTAHRKKKKKLRSLWAKRLLVEDTIARISRHCLRCAFICPNTLISSQVYFSTKAQLLVEARRSDTRVV